MADYQKKHGDFTLFVNDRKREGKQDPDRTGSIMLYDEEGKLREYWFKGWIKETKNGDKYLSGCIGDEKVPRK